MDINMNSEFCSCNCDCDDGTMVQYVFVGCGHNQRGWADPPCDCPLRERLRYEEILVEDNQDFHIVSHVYDIYLGG